MTGPADDPDYPLLADASAERHVLGTLLLDAGTPAARDLAADLRPDLFHDPRCEQIAGSVARLTARDLPATGPAVLDDLRAAEGTDHRYGQLANLVANLVTESVPWVSIPGLMRRLAELAALREVLAATRRTQQRIRGIAEQGDHERLGEVLADMRLALDGAEQQGAAADAPPAMTLAELLQQEVEYDWLVPDLLERMDRVIFTGPEGSGKSELVHQFAMCMAGGLHPWTGQPLNDDGTGLRVVVADAENTEKQLVRRLRRHAAIVDKLRVQYGFEPKDWTELYHHLVIKPEGFELAAGDDAARLSVTLDTHPADLLVIGPIYKLTTADVNEATEVRKMLGALDKLRARHHCAILLEHHPGHAQGKNGRSMRPAGSSLFQRWPEFGFGLKREDGAIALQPWRGQREERAWPDHITRTSRLPWAPADEDWWAEHG